MLSSKLQERLAARFSRGGMLKKAFDQRVLESFQVEFEKEAEAPATAMFVDVAGFAGKTTGKSASQLRNFLDGYYELAIPEIHERGGKIDRIAGDGILAVFSPFFGTHTLPDSRRLALRAAEAVVARTAGTPWAAKAALGIGPLLFCKTGLSLVYEDFTVVGTPITTAYRLEEYAQAGQVLVPTSVLAAGELILASLSSKQGVRAEWELDVKHFDLRGVGSTETLVKTWVPPPPP